MPRAGGRSLFDSVLIVQDKVEISKMEANSGIDLNALLALFEKKKAALEAAITGVKVLMDDPEFKAAGNPAGSKSIITELEQHIPDSIELDNKC